MDRLQSAPKTMCLTMPGLAAGTTTTLTQTLVAGATANVFVLRGKFVTAAALSNTAAPTADYATGLAFKPVLANQGCVYMIGFNAGAALKAIQGTIVPLDANGNFINAPQFGADGPGGEGVAAGAASEFCPIGYLVIKCGATASNTAGWVFGTNNMSGVTGVTYSFTDICGFPDRPQIA